MSNYEVHNIGAPSEWMSHVGGFRPSSTKPGRRVVDHEMDMQYIGMTANAMKPGDSAPFWHDHSQIEEVYVFLAGEGQMALDNDLVDVSAGSVVRVGQGVMRAWHCKAGSPGELQWLCIRAGGAELPEYPDDATRDEERPLPW